MTTIEVYTSNPFEDYKDNEFLILSELERLESFLFKKDQYKLYSKYRNLVELIWGLNGQ